MSSSHILQLLDRQIAALQQAKALLVGSGSAESEKPKRVPSPEARARIVAAQKKRWDKVRAKG